MHVRIHHSTLGWPKEYQNYTLAGLASLLVLSQSVGVKICLVLLKVSDVDMLVHRHAVQCCLVTSKLGWRGV